jgi:cytochrome P450
MSELALPRTPPVEDWAGDYDIFDPGYIADPFPIWDDLRRHCPVAHSERWGGSWNPTRYRDVVALARMVNRLSSAEPTVTPPLRDAPSYGVKAPPISSDPPEHTWARRLILPVFSPQVVEADHEPYTADLCRRLVDALAGGDVVDGAVDYAQQIPPRVIAHLLAIDEDRVDEFTEWVRGVLEIGLANPPVRLHYREKLIGFFMEELAKRKADPGDDFISQLIRSEVDGEPLPDIHILGTCQLMLIAGIDTTWSSIGSALWHLASHPEDRRRLVAEPDLVPTAVEEMLRAYSPVTMARVATRDFDYEGHHIAQGDRVLLNFPAANRDPEVFERPGEVLIDRQRNRHVAFGVGIHRCAGSNLARMEMVVALRTWLEAFPEFELADPDAVVWAGGQVRGPRRLPIRILS